MSTILLAHGHSDDREMYAEYLEAVGFDLLQVGATDAATAFLPVCDLLVMDLVLPGDVDVIELIAGAAHGRWGRAVPVVVVTACMIPNLHCRAAIAGANRILPKPCLPDDLLEVIDEALPRDSQSTSL